MRDPIEWEATLGIRPSSPAWRAAVKALYGSELSPDELALFIELSGGQQPPAGGTDEFLGVIGRRGGKSETIARLSAYEAMHGGHAAALAPGQIGLIPIISPLREQSGEILRYVKGLCQLPSVKPFVASETADSATFITGVRIQVLTADAVNVSGATVVTAVRDEWAKFPGDDSTMPDREIDNSLRPALAPVRGAPRRRLIGITSAYIQDGLAYETDRDHYGVADADVLVVRGTSQQFNPALDEKWLAKEQRRVGSAVYAREYEGIWQPAIVDSWFGADAIEQCVNRQRPAVLEPQDEYRYYGSIDPAFTGDGYALAICHREHRDDSPPVTVIDGVWCWKAERGRRLSSASIAAKVGRIVRSYGAALWCDNHHYESLIDIYRPEDIRLREAKWSTSNKAPKFWRYRDALQAKLIELPPDHPTIREHHAVRGEWLRSGTERIAARTGQHDDRVDACVIAATEAMAHEPDKRRPYARPIPQYAAVPFAGGNLLGLGHDPDELPAAEEIVQLAEAGSLPRLT
jgi:hypothetical protein